MRQRCVKPIARPRRGVSEPLLHRFCPVQANRGAKTGTRVFFPGRHTIPFKLVVLRGRQEAGKAKMARCRAQATRQGELGTFGKIRCFLSCRRREHILFGAAFETVSARSSLSGLGRLDICQSFTGLGIPIQAAPLECPLIGSVAVRCSRLLGLGAGARGPACLPLRLRSDNANPVLHAMDAKYKTANCMGKKSSALPRPAKKGSLNHFMRDVSLVWGFRKYSIVFGLNKETEMPSLSLHKVYGWTIAMWHCKSIIVHHLPLKG